MLRRHAAGSAGRLRRRDVEVGGDRDRGATEDRPRDRRGRSRFPRHARRRQGGPGRLRGSSSPFRRRYRRAAGQARSAAETHRTLLRGLPDHQERPQGFGNDAAGVIAQSIAGTTARPMSPDLAFILTLALRMAVTAAFVVTASVITERSGPVIGALVATLPISAGPSYVFLALDHDAAFVAEGALASLPINAATIFLGLTYVVLAQRQSAIVSCLSAVAVWVALASVIRTIHWSLAGGLIANAVAFAICVPLLRRFRNVKMPLITRRWYDIPLRASLVATLVATVVTLSGWVGPTVSGIIALFPVVFTSMMLILHPRIGGPATAAVLANSAGGLMGLGIAIAVLHVAALRFGSAVGLSLALMVCVSWNLGLWWNGRRKLAR